MSLSLLDQDTIAAPATVQGAGALAIVRVTGAQALTAVGALFRSKDLASQPSHTLHVGLLRSGEEAIDEVVVGIFKAPRSFTGEDVVEISCHGAPVIVAAILKALSGQGVRLAKPGEFTKRAFLNGRLDLVRAEAVADLIAAETDAARAVALSQMRGRFSSALATLRQELIHLAALIELELDFAEEDVALASSHQLQQDIERIQHTIGQLIDSFDRGNAIKHGILIAIVGKPNAGKSTLLNALLGEERAIVSHIPGTTRDVVDGEVEIDGIKFRFADTAGLRPTQDHLEALGIARARATMAKAALLIHVFDASNPASTKVENEDELAHSGAPRIRVANKMDIATPAQRARCLRDTQVVCLSALQPAEVKALKERIAACFQQRAAPAGEVTITNARHLQCLQQAHSALGHVLQQLSQGASGEWLAADIRQALHALGEITGAVDVEDILEDIFSRFCIGK